MNGKYHLQSVAAVESANPGFFAHAGPYRVNHKDMEMAKKHKAECVRALRGEIARCPHAIIVSHGPMAWMISKREPELFNPTKTFTSAKLGIKGGRAFIENKDRVRL